MPAWLITNRESNYNASAAAVAAASVVVVVVVVEGIIDSGIAGYCVTSADRGPDEGGDLSKAGQIAITMRSRPKLRITDRLVQIQ
eukprot:scaffold8267_cov177-Amphora_coffeaeformis.AAC.2